MGVWNEKPQDHGAVSRRAASRWLRARHVRAKWGHARQKSKGEAQFV